MRRAWVLLGLVTVLPAGAATVGEVRCLTARPARWERVEAAVAVAGSWRNPFDPDEIAVDAEVRAPSGRVLRTPAFWSRDYRETVATTAPGQQVDLLKFYLATADWPRDATEATFYLADLALLDAEGHEVPLSRVPGGDGAWGPVSNVAPVGEPTHEGRPALRFHANLRGTDAWPGATLALPKVDWRAYRGVSLWVYPQGPGPLGPLALYDHDAAHGNSDIIRWGPEELKPNAWNHLVWRWTPPTPTLKLAAQGEPGWRLRFTPTEAGVHTLTVTARQGQATATSRPVTIDVAPADHPGFVRVSRDDPHYFVTDDGKPYVPLGHDVAWRVEDVLALYPKMAAHGENATYFILAPWDLSVEWAKLGEYDLERAAKVDRVIEAGERNGIRLKLSFDVHDAMRPSKLWSQNPYNTARGGPCASPNEFYTSPAAWAHYRKRLRYQVARWGYSPAVMAWEPFAENDGATMLGQAEGWGYPNKPGGEQVSVMLTTWLAKLGEELGRLDPYGRMLTCSFGSGYSDPNVWRLPAIAYTQIHQYNVADTAEGLGRWARELTGAYAKPMMVTEFGWSTEAVPNSVDPEGVDLHNGLWATVCSGSAGGPLAWWWERIDALDLYRQFPPLRRFTDGIDWPREAFRPLTGEVKLPAPDHFSPVLVPATAPFTGSTADRFEVRRDGSVTGAGQVTSTLMAHGRKERRLTPVFVVDYPQAGTFGVQVDTVSPDATLDLSVDGKLVRRVELPAHDVPGKRCVFDAQWQVWRCTYQETYTVPVPAGRHEVQVENSHPGASWIRVSAYHLAPYRPPGLNLYGLTGRTWTVLWLHQRDSLGCYGPPSPLNGATLSLTGLPDGMRRVEWWDPWSGSVTAAQATVQGGRATLDVPPVARDVACRLRREAQG